MGTRKVVIIPLRRPWNDEGHREDPFWECGSFGIIGWHSTNVMNPATGAELEGGDTSRYLV
jgi:hypothetical protein